MVNVELIQKISKQPYASSELWNNITKQLKTYLETGDLNLYKINNIAPHVFTWAEMSGQNIKALNFLEKDKDNIFYKTAINTNNYGPFGIKLYKYVQLDRVAQIWSIYNLVNVLNLNLNDNEIILEFGGGTGQMSDVLSNLNFKGRHIVYDLPLMTVLQSHFVGKRSIKNTHILDDEPINLINGTNYLPCNQPLSEKYIMGLPDVNFVATYSLSETDIETHNKFAEYIMNFKRIYIVYIPTKSYVGDYIDNGEYIQNIKTKLELTHYCHIGSDYGSGLTFLAVKKDIINNDIIIIPLE